MKKGFNLNKYHVYILIISFTLLNGCKQDRYNESRIVYQEALDIHDDVMPRMGEMMNLQMELKSILSENKDDQILIEEVNLAIVDLEQAHEGMMEWMRNLTKVPSDDANSSHPHEIHEDKEADPPPPSEMLRIQQAQKNEILNVREQILNSIEAANRILKKQNK